MAIIYAIIGQAGASPPSRTMDRTLCVTIHVEGTISQQIFFSDMALDSSNSKAITVSVFPVIM